ncbi:MAG: S49 family peptidase [Rubricella sp.]
MKIPTPAFLRRMRAPFIPVIRLSGAIGAGGGGLSRTGLSDASLAPVIEKAFSRGEPKAVALAINSPGGSPAQSALIAARIRRLADEKNIPVHAFVEDVAASGGYWLACAGDDIHCDANSILGSIGVISAGFGFHELIAKWGIERRVHTAGDEKALLDPFQPEDPDDLALLKDLQRQIHENFKAHVRARRGQRLTLAEDELFTGRVWVGQSAVDGGLADGIGHLVPVLKERYGEKIRLVPINQRRSFFSRMGGPGVEDLAAAMDERLLRARYGL